MTDLPGASATQDASGQGPTPAPRTTKVNAPVRQASIIAGVGLLMMSALAVFANFVVIEGLVTTGDADGTAADIMGAEGTFRLGVVSWLLIAVLDVVIAWALYLVLSPVSARLSLLAAWFRLLYAGVLVVAVIELLGALHLMSGDGYLAVLDPGQRNAHAMLNLVAFKDIWDAGLILFGLHLAILGYLVLRSGYVPKILGVLLVIAGIGYVVDTSAAFLALGLPFRISSFTFLGEFLLAIWLVIWGRRLTLQESPTTAWSRHDV